MPSLTKLLAGAAAAVTFATIAVPASAQTNPFIPSSGASKADVEKIIEQRLREFEARQAKTAATAPKPGTPAVPGAPVAGAPGAPGTPAAGTPLAPGAPGVAPGTIAPYGAPGAIPTAPAAPKPDAVDEARKSNVRFLGCINGVPKFVKASGERVSFTQAELNRAVKAGYLPSCR